MALVPASDSNYLELLGEAEQIQGHGDEEKQQLKKRRQKGLLWSSAKGAPAGK